MKKYLKSLIICFILVPCLFLLFACNGTTPAIPPTLTKQEYAKALLAVSTSLSSSEEARTNSLNKKMSKLSSKSTVSEFGPPQVIVTEEDYLLELGESCSFNELNNIDGMTMTYEVQGETVGSKNECISKDDDGNPVFTPQMADTYIITITATNKNGVSTSKTLKIVVRDTLNPTMELNNNYPHSNFVSYTLSTIFVNEECGEGETDDNGNEIKWAENKFPSVNIPGIIVEDEYEETGFSSLVATGFVKVVTPDETEVIIDNEGNITSSQNEIFLQIKTNDNGSYYTFTPTKRGHYTVTYSAQDQNGNKAEREETIDVYVGDTQVPIIYLTDNITNKLNQTFLVSKNDELVINTQARIKDQTNYYSYDFYVSDNCGFNTSQDEENGEEYEFVLVSVLITNEDDQILVPKANQDNPYFVTYKFDAKGTYTITLTVTDKGGNVGTISRNFVVEEDTENPNIYLTYNFITELNNGFVVSENDELEINTEARIKQQLNYNTKHLYVEDNYGFNTVFGMENDASYEYVLVSVIVTNEDGIEVSKQESDDENIVKYKFDVQGTYTITFTVTDSCGNVGTLSKTFIVTNPTTTTPVNPTDPTNPTTPTTNVSDPTNSNQTNCDKSMAVLLFKFVSLVMQNPNYEVTDSTIAYNLHVNTVNLSETVYLKQRLSYNGTYITGAFISSDSETSPYHETITFKIKYNFDANTLISYEINDEYVMADRTIYQNFILEDNQEYGFRCESTDTLNEQAEIIKLKVHNACKVELEKQATFKADYNFDNEYILATQG